MDTDTNAGSGGITRTETSYVVQADMGRGNWYDFEVVAGECAGRARIARIRQQRDFERHRLVRRTVVDVEMPS